MALYNKTIDEETEKVKEGIGDSLDSLGDKATIEVIPGYTPAADILGYAEKVNADLIVRLSWPWRNSRCSRFGFLRCSA